MNSFIPVSSCHLSGNEKKYVGECLDSSWISSNGSFVTAFEKKFAEFCNAGHAIATCNGTVSMHLALLALGLEPGDEVIIPTVTYIATANAVRYCGATPVLADCDPHTWNLIPDQAAKAVTPKTKGIIPVHLYGHPVDMDPIMDLAAAHNLFVLEDAAEAHGALYKGKKVGSIGQIASFSFFGNKIITTGEGGMLTTNDDKLAATMRLLRGQGMDPQRRYWFPVVGYNYRMTNIAAAIGLAQLEQIERHLAHRQRIAGLYNCHLAPLAREKLLIPPRTAPWAHHVFWMYTIQIGQRAKTGRDETIEALARAGIETRPVFYPMHILPPYLEDAGKYPLATRHAALGISLPTHALLEEADIKRICQTLGSILRG
jgi:perosamine synthetase